MPTSDFDPDYVFSHHHATPQKLADYEAIHNGAKAFATGERLSPTADR